MNDLVALSECGVSEAASGVYEFLPSVRSAFMLPQNSVPWVIQWLCAKLSRKHIFLPSRRPPLNEVGRAIGNWGRKVLWKHELGEQEDPWRRIKVKPRDTPPFERTAPCDLREFVVEVSNAVWDACSKARQIRYPPAECGSMNGLFKHALDMISSGSQAIVPTDKDGGYCLLPKRVWLSEKLRILSSSWYNEVSPWAHRPNEIVSQYISACKRVGRRRRDDAFSAALISGARTYNASGVVSSLVTLVKTHKPPGRVEFRGVHASMGNPLLGGMRFVSHMLRPFLAECSWILKDTPHLLETLRTTRVTEDARLFKADVSDFYMSGTHDMLTSTCADAVVEEWRADFKEVLSCILDSQYVACEEDPCRLWKVIRGTGMGVACSGDCSDTAFAKLAEVGFVDARETRRHFDLQLYVRYKDDIFWATAAPLELQLEFFRELRRRAQPFGLKVEETSLQEVVMLDVQISKATRHAETGFLDTCVHVKKSSVWAPLTPSSGHPPGVHRAWPFGQILRYQRLCSHPKTRFEKVEGLYNILRRAGVHTEQREARPRRSPIPAPIRVSSRLVLPWRPHWAAAKIPQLLRSFALRWTPTLGSTAVVNVAWSNAAPHTYLMIRRRSMTTDVADGEEDGG